MPKKDKRKKGKIKASPKSSCIDKIDPYIDTKKRNDEWHPLTCGCFLRKRLPCCQWIKWKIHVSVVIDLMDVFYYTQIMKENALAQHV